MLGLKKGIFIAWTVMVFLTNVLWSEVFCVSSATELQTVLDKAATNGQSDLIKVAQGTYVGNFVYDSDQGDSITLLGGYNTGCTIRVVNPLNTVLNGGGLGRVLYLNNSKGGDIFVEGYAVQNGDTTGSGGGIYARSSADSGVLGDVYIVNNTITGNSSLDHGGGLKILVENYVEMHNNIIWGNMAPTGADIYLDGGGVAFGFRNDYSDMHGSWLSYGGNIDADPLFVDSSGGDYHLRSISPCVDAGYNSPPSLPPFDRDGDPRIIYGKYDGDAAADMGADEFVRHPVCDGHDFNGNGSSDVSVWRPANGRWYLKDIGGHVWGMLGDLPVVR